MDALSESPSEDPVRARQAEILARPMTLARHMADAIRALAIDATDMAQSSYPNVPLGMADSATALWTRYLKFDAADSRWPDRDRFVLSADHGALLLYALIHLTGHDGLSIDDLRDFRQFHSPAAAYPEYGGHPAIEATTGPAGQGLATAVGLALAERNMAARFGKSLVDHRTWVIASDGDMMSGISHEAATLAGDLGLSKLAVLYDQGHTATATDKTFYSEDVLRRFSASGWATKRVDGHDPAQISAALSFAVRSKKPTLIACRTGFGAQPAGEARDNLDPAFGPAAARARLDWHEPPFVVPDNLKDRWHAVGSRGAAARRSWLKRLARHHQRAEFERVIAGRLPDSWHETVLELKQQTADDRPRLSSRAASEGCLEALASVTPELVGGTACLEDMHLKFMPAIASGNYGGRYIQFGVRDHGMAAAANGMALHGGIIPCICTGLACIDDIRPALRLAALMRQRVVYCVTQGAVGDGQDRAGHQRVEHLAGLRATPNLHVFRPCDAMETAECWELAMRRSDGPSLFDLSCQPLPAWRTDTTENRCARGGYVFAEAEGARQATIIATGPEVPIAMAAREKLAGDNIAAAVVSLPCWELFVHQEEAYRAQVLGGAPRVGLEAAAAFGWERWLGPDGTFIGLTGSGIGVTDFGASAHHQDHTDQFGITPDTVVAAVIRRL
jgi:transketolase